MKTLYVYTRPGCGSCIEAKNFLNQLKIPYTEININVDAVGLQFLQNQGDRYLPQFYVEGKKFMPGSWNTIRTMRQHEILDRLK